MLFRMNESCKKMGGMHLRHAVTGEAKGVLLLDGPALKVDCRQQERCPELDFEHSDACSSHIVKISCPSHIVKISCPSHIVKINCPPHIVKISCPSHIVKMNCWYQVRPCSYVKI